MSTPKKINIAYFIPIFTGAAMARWMKHFSYYLDKEKYSISYVCIKTEEQFAREIPKDITIIKLDNFFIPGVLLKIATYLIKEKPDIFISNAPHISTISVMAKILAMSRAQIFIIEHNNFSLLADNVKGFSRRVIGKYILPRLMRICYPLAGAITCVSEGVAKDLSLAVHIPGDIKVIYDPVTNPRIFELADEPVGHPWFLDLKIPVIVAAGRLEKQKDYPTLLRAFKIVSSHKNVRLVIMGEGSQEEELKSLTKNLLLSQRVAFIGFQKNPYQYMKGASVFVLSSIHEGFGRVIVEAMASGAPVVSTNCKSGPDEIIEDGVSGILVPVSDDKALARAIIKVLDDPALAQNLSREGRKRAEFFSFEKGVREHEKIFQQIYGK